MRPTSSLLAIVASLLLMSESAAAAEPDWTAVAAYIGCFKSAGGLTFAMKDNYNSQGKCRNKCTSLKKKYSATTDFDQCYCGDTLPPESDIEDNDKCNQSCPGFPTDPCGSRNGDFTIFLTDGSATDPRLYDGSGKGGTSTDTTDSPTSTSVPVTTITQQGTVFVTTVPETSAPAPSHSSGNGMNKAGIAAGAVVGVLAAIAIGAGAFIFIRRQKRRKLEEEYRRSVAVREYQQKKPETDLRLDPVILQRRMSDGSIADNHDYSRRILKVTNPDGN